MDQIKPIKKSNEIAKEVIEKFKDGEYDITDYIRIKNEQKAYTAAFKNAEVKEIIHDLGLELNKQEFHGYLIQVKATKTVFDFTDCGHAEYNEIIEILDTLNERKKQLEASIKTIKGDPRNEVMQKTWKLIESEGDELCEVFPCKVLKTEGVAITEVK